MKWMNYLAYFFDMQILKKHNEKYIYIQYKNNKI